MTLMEWLMLATGVSGALTVIWLVGLVQSCFVRSPVVELYAGSGVQPGGLLDRVLREIAAARREILFCTDLLENPSVAEALLAARSRGLTVEILLGTVAEVYTGSTLGMFLQQQLFPLIDDHASRIACHGLLIDGRTLLLASGPFHTEEEQCAGGVYLLRVQNLPEILGVFREILSALRTRSRPARQAPLPSPSSTFPVQTAMAAGAASSPSAPAQAAATPSTTDEVAETHQTDWSYYHAETAQWAAPPSAETQSNDWPTDPTQANASPSGAEASAVHAPAVHAPEVEEPLAAASSPQSLEDPLVSVSTPAVPVVAANSAPTAAPAVTPVASLLSRPLATYEAKATAEDELRQRMPRTARPALILEDHEDDEATPAAPPLGSTSATAPPVSQAAAELFARLRREVQARANKSIPPQASPPVPPGSD